MTAADLIDEFRRLNEQEQRFFLHSMSAWLLLNLPDGEYLMLTKNEYRKISHQAEMYKSVRDLIEK